MKTTPVRYRVAAHADRCHRRHWIQVCILSVLPFLAGATPETKLVLPSPSGDYAVGTRVYGWTDLARHEKPAEARGALRRLAVQIWYPATRTGREVPTPYMDEPTAKAYTRSFKLPSGFQSLLFSHAQPGVAMARAERPFPVLVFSHGLGETRFSYVSLMEDLASQGFLVASINHSYSSRLTRFPDGSTIPWGESIWPEDRPDVMKTAITRNLSTWVEDILFTIGQLEKLDSTEEFAGKLNLTRLGVAGHSYGGTAAVLASLRDDRVRAVLNFDGGIYEGLKKPVTLRTPFLFVGNPANRAQRNCYAKRDADDRFVFLEGASHISFSDLPLLFGHFGRPDREGGKLPPLRGITLTRELARGFFAEHLQDRQGALAGTIGKIPESR